MTMSRQESGRIGGLKAAKFQREQKNKRIEKYNLDPVRCKCCDKELSYEKRNNRFCSRSCAASITNLGTIRNTTTGEWIKKECLYCQKITTNSKFCNSKCQQAHNWQKRKKEIDRNGQATGKVTAIRYLKETRGDKCEICGLDEWNGKDIVMIMDYIDGDATNNIIPNLRLICPNCDSQTPTYKGRNKGNGRHSRRIRYAENKSY